MSKPCAYGPLIHKVYAHAEENYDKGGWDVIVECWEYSSIRDHLEEHGIEPTATIEEALKTFEALIDIWSDRQADARNSAF